MIIDALLASLLVAAASVAGAFLFGNKSLGNYEKFVIPTAVGVFLSLAFYELIPETLAANNEYGGLLVAAGFISFIFSQAIYTNAITINISKTAKPKVRLK